jgi:hypothetical protein
LHLWLREVSLVTSRDIDRAQQELGAALIVAAMSPWSHALDQWHASSLLYFLTYWVPWLSQSQQKQEMSLLNYVKKYHLGVEVNCLWTGLCFPKQKVW